MSYFDRTKLTDSSGNVINPATEDQIGEVQATPTSNTVLGRLKDLLTGIVLAAGNAIIGKVGIDQTTPGTTNGVQVNAALPTGSNVVGKVGIDQTTPGTTNNVVDTRLAIAAGLISGMSSVNKFGYAPDFDTADGEVTVWDGAEDGVAWENMAYDYSSSADIDSVSSSDQLNDVGLDVTIEGLDSDYNVVTQTATLDATDARTRVALSTSLIRVYRAYNSNGTAFTGHVVIYPNTALTAGIPTDKSKIRAIIHPDAQQTEMAIYTIPAGKTGYMRSFYASTAGASRSTDYVVRVKTRDDGKVFRLKHRISLTETGTSWVNHTYEEPPSFAAKTDIELTVESTGGGVSSAALAAGFDIVLVDN